MIQNVFPYDPGLQNFLTPRLLQRRQGPFCQIQCDDDQYQQVDSRTQYLLTDMKLDYHKQNFHESFLHIKSILHVMLRATSREFLSELNQMKRSQRQQCQLRPNSGRETAAQHMSQGPTKQMNASSMHFRLFQTFECGR